MKEQAFLSLLQLFVLHVLPYLDWQIEEDFTQVGEQSLPQFPSNRLLFSKTDTVQYD